MAEKKSRNMPESEAEVRAYWSLGREAVRRRQGFVSYGMTEANSAPSKAWPWASLCAWNRDWALAEK